VNAFLFVTTAVHQLMRECSQSTLTADWQLVKLSGGWPCFWRKKPWQFTALLYH